jgi:hypothetical protein
VSESCDVCVTTAARSDRRRHLLQEREEALDEQRLDLLASETVAMEPLEVGGFGETRNRVPAAAAIALSVVSRTARAGVTIWVVLKIR